MDEKTEKNVNLNQGEINALKKAILYLKFECEETSSLIFSGSELINSAFDKLLLKSDMHEREIDFYQKGNLNAQNFILEKIHRQEAFNGVEKKNSVIHNDYLNCCLHPFKKKVE